MIKFKLESRYISAQDRRSFLRESARTLPMTFLLSDVKPGMFSNTVMRRLTVAKRDGAYIEVARGRLYSVGIKVINTDDRERKQKVLRKLERNFRMLLKHTVVLEYLDLKSKLKALNSKVVSEN